MSLYIGIKRGLALLAAVLLLSIMTMQTTLADQDDASQTGDADAVEAGADGQSGEGRLVETDVVALGTVPFETESEEGCDVILAVDVATDVLINEKNLSIEVPVGGAVVQLMTALVALDYLNMDDVLTVTEQQEDNFSASKGNLGLETENEVTVRDLIASMLYNGAYDSALVISDAVKDRAGVDSIGGLMAEKAEELGMESTDYSECDGIGTEQIMTTATDQCELYLEALNNDQLIDILESGVYTVESYNDGINENIPEKLTNNVTVTVPENKYYDLRLSSAVSCTVKTEKSSGYNLYNVVFYHAVDTQSDIVFAIWIRAGSSKIRVKTVTDLADIFSKRTIIDLVPYIKAEVNSFSITKNGVTISGWSLKGDNTIYGCQMVSYDPDADVQDTSGNFDISKMTISLEPEQDSLTLNDDGSRTVTVKVMINNSVVDTVVLTTAAKTSSESSSEQNNITIYTDEDVTTLDPTLMSQYGWMIIVGGVVLLAIITIIIGISIRNRMER